MTNITTIRKKWFGDWPFYRQMLTIAIPLIIQQMITSFVNMLDNIMVGRTGTLQMSGVSVANQIVMIFYLALFGSLAAAAIFGAQYAGKKDEEGQRFCFRYKLIAAVIVSALSILISFLFGEKLVMLFLNSEANSAADIAETLKYAVEYMEIVAVGIIPFSLSQALSSSMAESGETRLPMISSVTAVFVNLIFNYILIFGHFGFPEMGCVGAAVATNISRVVQLVMNLYFVKMKSKNMPFFSGSLNHFRIPMNLAKDITIKGFPLMLNEVLWSIGMAAITQCYSVRGIDAIAAFNIQNTITNIFFVFNFAMGDVISIMVGQKLGAGDPEDAVDTNTKLIVFTTILTVFLGIALVMSAPLFPNFYVTSDAIRKDAASMLVVAGWTLWIAAIYNAAYFTLRCGGKTVITFLFDSAGTIGVSLPIAFALAHWTDLSIVWMFLVLRCVDFYKVILGLYLVKKRVWVNDLVHSE